MEGELETHVTKSPYYPTCGVGCGTEAVPQQQSDRVSSGLPRPLSRKPAPQPPAVHFSLRPHGGRRARCRRGTVHPPPSFRGQWALPAVEKHCGIAVRPFSALTWRAVQLCWWLWPGGWLWHGNPKCPWRLWAATIPSRQVGRRRGDGGRVRSTTRRTPREMGRCEPSAVCDVDLRRPPSRTTGREWSGDRSREVGSSTAFQALSRGRAGLRLCSCSLCVARSPLVTSECGVKKGIN